MRNIFNWIKSNPYKSGGAVFLLGIVIFFSSRKTATSSDGRTVIVNPNENPQVQALAYQTNAAVNIAQAEASAATNIASINAQAALEAKSIESQVVENVATTQSQNQLNSVQAVIDAQTSRLGKQGVNGIVGDTPDHPVEFALRREGFTGLFGDGAGHNFIVSKLGGEANAQAWYRANGADWL